MIGTLQSGFSAIMRGRDSQFVLTFHFSFLLFNFPMHIVHVHVHVSADQVEAFRVATLENARNSVQEPGVLRFDVLQQSDDPTRFLLIEIYKTPDDQLKHRDTPHYLKWRDAVAPMMAEPRNAVKYAGVMVEGLEKRS